MNTYNIYKGIKARLNVVAPVFYFIGQYLRGKDNTSYKVPALYIEMPKNLQINYFNRQAVARNAEVKIHLISNAPFKNHDTGVQDNSLNDHQAMIDEVCELLKHWALKNAENKLLTQQFTLTNVNAMYFDGMKVWSILTFKTEFNNI
jgi:hypothetical protein